MSRNVALPLLGLIGIVLFSLNQLSRPVDVEPGGFAEPIVLEDEWDEPAPRPALSATPPPAPRLQSEVQTADVLEADAPVPPDTVGTEPGTTPDDLEADDLEGGETDD